MTAMKTDPCVAEMADVETSSDDYARRFSGAVGGWMLSVQERLTLDLLAAAPGVRRVLDVGGGHGQLAGALCREGYAVTVVGSAASCGHRISNLVEDNRCKFEVANLLSLPYPEDAFDAVLSFRLLTHCEHWPVLVRELCRVAATAVIVDYPSSHSLNVVAPFLFRAKKRVEKNTRPWRSFHPADIRSTFERHGFKQRHCRKQFFLPMVVHRMLRRRTVSRTAEGLCRALALTRFWGSPVIVEMRRDSTESESGGRRPEVPKRA